MLTVLRELLAEARVAAGGLLFADRCAICHRPRPASKVPGLCGPCAQSLPRVATPYCEVCGEWFVGQITGSFRCANCRERRFDFEFAYAPLQSRGEARELVHRFKYGRELWLCQTLAALLATALGGETAEPRLASETAWLLVPVPLHPRRLREREFNQALELSRALAHHTGLAVADVLRRTRYTTGQASLDRAGRLANLRKAFALRRPVPWRPQVKDRAVLLIDDVFTTGATTHECARVLKHIAGARRIVVLTVARG
jgi:competence protein ComFC